MGAPEGAGASTKADDASTGTGASSPASGGTQQTRQFGQVVREAATAQLDHQKTRATEGLGFVANAVRRLATDLGEQGGIAEYLQGTAGRIEGFGRRLEERDLDEVIRDVQSFGRRNPALFLGASFALGIAFSRFIRSSAAPARP